MSKKLISAVAAASLGVATLSTPVMAEVTATAGFVSDYYFRGANLGDGGANGSIDWANDSGFSAGIWAIDDGTGGNDGLEYDVYGGYAAETDSFSYSIGYARYEYTYGSNFEHEVNLGLGVGAFGLAVDIGEADPNDDVNDPTDYNHVAVSWAANDVYGLTLGQVDPDTDTDDDEWTYVEVGASGEVSELDVSMTLGTVSGDNYPNTTGYMVLSVSKTFDSPGF